MGELVFAPFPAGSGAPRPESLPPEPRGWSEERRLWWLLWQGCPGIGWSRLQRIERQSGGLKAAWRLPIGQLLGPSGMAGLDLQRVEAYRRRWGEDPLSGEGRNRLRLRKVLLPGDPAFPQALLDLQRPPLVIHWGGRGSLWPLLRRRQAVAVVGTRRPSPHGLAIARGIGAALAEAGWPVISGLAEGIDAAAHGGCLARGGSPVAVLGTPLDRVYPRHHVDLQRRVQSEGLLVTEQGVGAGIRPGNFASRNRLQVALARAVVVVECPASSGALHSASLAWDQSLPLWVVPADAGKASALGSNRLLARGATPLLDPDDLVRQLGAGPLLRGFHSVPGLKPPVSSGSAELLAALGQGACLEQLCLALGESPAELSIRLLELELAGRIRAEAGLAWRPC